MSFFRALRTSLVVCWTAFGAHTALAQTPDNPVRDTTIGRITLRNAVARVLDANPKLNGQRFALASADARIGQAALRPAYELGIEAEDILGTDRLSTFNDSVITLQLSTVLEFGGKRASRVAAAERERDLMLSELDAEKLDTMAEVARRFIRLAAAQQQVAMAAQSLDLAGNTSKVVRQRVSAGRGPAAEDRNADIALARAEIETLRANTAVAQAWESLAAMWSGGGSVPAEAVADLFTLPQLQSLAVLEDLLRQNPSLARFATERRVHEAKLRLAEAAASTDLTLGAGVRRLVGDRSNAFVVSLSMPLGAGGRAAPYTAEARSNLQQVDAREQSARAELAATLRSFHHDAALRAAEIGLLKDKAIPQAESANTLTRSGFAAGRFSLLELLSSQQQLVEVQRAAIEAAVAYHNALIEIERLTAAPATEQ
ncbi:MAG: TolC family protein [Rhodospirillaceae bacterium]|nr:TolC family protein [Rhodospirillaceae bacterium]